jgi:photosystem II stability/assembly factor-like uncharacterized protein
MLVRCFSRSLFILLLISNTALAQLDPSQYQEMRWRLIGPFRGGRSVALAGIPDQPNVFYMAPSNGGVWKTDDYGRTWTPIFDDQPTGSIGALAIAPSNPQVLYVGSGEGLRRPDLSVGNGIYKSPDAGKSWQHLGLQDGQQIASILVDPGDPNRVFAAVLGHPYGPNEERGVFRSLDGGASWQKILYKDENTGAVDLAFDPRNPQTVYAVLWASRRPPWTNGTYSGPGSGLFKSVDGGNNWTQLTKGLPDWHEGLGRIGITVAPTNSNRLYALVDSPKAGGLYRSDDAGESWQRVNEDERIWGRGDDFACVRVDPRNEDVVWITNISTYRSQDAGKSFTAIKGAPGGDDYHTVWINPKNPEIIGLAVDQGVTISVNGGRTWSSWYNQPTAQFYHVITDNQFPYWVYGGQQESGSIGTASRSDFGEITFRDWTTVGVEEYGYVAPDPLNPNLIYGGKVTRFDRVTGQTQDVSPVILRTGKYRFNRTAPLLFSPVDPHTLYLGSNVLFKTNDGGNSWQIISPDLTRPDPGIPASLGLFAQSDPAAAKHRGVIYSIAPSPKDGNLIWIGTDDGLIQVTRDSGKNWQNITPPELTPWSKVAQMDASHFDHDTVYAAVNRFRVNDLKPYIYRTHDGGKSWQLIVNGLPNEPVNTVREDPMRRGLLFAGTEGSVYVSFDDGDHWQSLRQNLPATSIRDLVVHNDDLVIGTHGRSFWILDNITPLRQASAKVAQGSAFLFAPQMTYRVRRNNNTDTPLPPEEPAGQNPPDGVMIDYFLGSTVKGPVTLEILDSHGKTVRRFSSDDRPDAVDANELNIPTYWIRPNRMLLATPGMHRFVWGLHYPAPDSVTHEYPISAIYHDTPRYPTGTLAMPGQYSVKLTAGGQSYTQPLNIKMDPRVKTGQAGLQALFTLETRIVDAMNRDYRALKEVTGAHEELSARLKQGLPGDLETSIKNLEAKTAALQGDPEGGLFLNDPAGRSFARLSAALYTLLGSVDGADAAPTTQAEQTFANVDQAVREQMEVWEKIKSQEIPDLNRKLKDSGAQPLKMAAGDVLPGNWETEPKARGSEEP